MRVSDIFRDIQHSGINNNELRLLRTACSDFFEQANSQPLLKNLNQEPPFSKVKVRFHKKTNSFIDIFNRAFYEKHHISNLHQLAIFASPQSTFSANKEQASVFIFPKNGFKFLYNAEVTDANVEYGVVFDQLFETIDNQAASGMLKELLQYTYKTENLSEAIRLNAEVILFNISHYYAVRVDQFDSYSSLLSLLK